MTFPWLPFLSYILIMAWTPGPNDITSMNNGLRVGFRRCIPYLLGIFCGMLIMMLACFLFTAALYAFLPKIQLPLKILGALYMLYLAAAPFLPAHAHAAKQRGSSWAAGLTLQFVNAKIMLMGITVASSFILPHYKIGPILGLFALLMACNSIIAASGWALFGAFLNGFYTKHQRLVNIVMALLLVYCAGSLFL
jgi:threonine/homoserine/homoserine lactone efflux protein